MNRSKEAQTKLTFCMFLSFLLLTSYFVVHFRDGPMAAIIELLTIAAIVITVVAGLLQIYDRLAKKNTDETTAKKYNKK